MLSFTPHITIKTAKNNIISNHVCSVHFPLESFCVLAGIFSLCVKVLLSHFPVIPLSTDFEVSPGGWKERTDVWDVAGVLFSPW